MLNEMIFQKDSKDKIFLGCLWGITNKWDGEWTVSIHLNKLKILWRSGHMAGKIKETGG